MTVQSICNKRYYVNDYQTNICARDLGHKGDHMHKEFLESLKEDGLDVTKWSGWDNNVSVWQSDKYN